MARPVSRDPLRGAQGVVRPAARPVDTFVKPIIPKAQPTGFEGLASALSGLNNGLAKYQQSQLANKVEQDKIDIDEGRAAYEAAQTKLGEAVKKGVIPAGASPAFLRGYARADLRTMGTDYSSYLTETFGENYGLAEDAEGYAKWEKQAFLNYASANFADKSYSNADIMEEFMPARYKVRDKLQTDTIKRNIKAVEAERKLQVQNEVTRILDDGVDSNTDFETLGASLSKVVGDYVATDPTQGKWSNERLIEIISAEALASGNPDVFKVAKHIKTGGGGTLDGVSKFRKARATVEDQILDNAIQAEKHNQWRADQARDSAIRSLTSDLFNDRYSSDTQSYNAKVAQLAKFDAAKASSLLKLRDYSLDRVMQPTVPTDARNRLTLRIAKTLTGESDEDPVNIAAEAAENSEFDPRDTSMVMRAIQAQQTEALRKLKTDPEIKASLSLAVRGLSSALGTDPMGKFFEDDDLRQEVESAKLMMRIEALEWLKDNSEGDSIEFSKWVRDRMNDRVGMLKAANDTPDKTPDQEATELIREGESVLRELTIDPSVAPPTAAQVSAMITNWNDDGLRDAFTSTYGESAYSGLAAFMAKRQR